MLKLDTAGTYYTPQEAERVAAELNETDDWAYTVRHDPAGTGYSRVDVHDEDGEYITTL